MKTLNEQKVLSTIHLSDTQKMVMSKIKSAANATVALEQINKGTNLVAAKNTLAKLGLIIINDAGAVVTSKGEKVMSDENLIDSTGTATDDSQKFIDAKDINDLSNKDEPAKEPEKPQVDGEDSPTDGIATESISLFKDINAMAKVKML